MTHPRARAGSGGAAAPSVCLPVLSLVQENQGSCTTGRAGGSGCSLQPSRASIPTPAALSKASPSAQTRRPARATFLFSSNPNKLNKKETEHTSSCHSEQRAERSAKGGACPRKPARAGLASVTWSLKEGPLLWAWPAPSGQASFPGPGPASSRLDCELLGAAAGTPSVQLAHNEYSISAGGMDRGSPTRGGVGSSWGRFPISLCQALPRAAARALTVPRGTAREAPGGGGTVRPRPHAKRAPTLGLGLQGTPKTVKNPNQRKRDQALLHSSFLFLPLWQRITTSSTARAPSPQPSVRRQAEPAERSLALRLVSSPSSLRGRQTDVGSWSM